MARKRKRTEQAPVTLEELPRETKELTNEEAVAAKGGWVALYYGGRTPSQQAEEHNTILSPYIEQDNVYRGSLS